MSRAMSRAAPRDARIATRASRRARGARRAAEDDARATPTRPALNLLGRTVKVKHILEGRADDALGRLAADVVADARGVDADALARDVDRLFALCPGLGERVARGEVKRALAAELAVDLRETMAAMLAIKNTFASADVDAGDVCAREPRLLRLREEALEGVRERAASTRERLGDACDADGLFATIPSCLLASQEELDGILERVTGLRALMPDADIVKLLRGRPALCLEDRAYSRAAIAVSALRKAMPKDCRIDLMLSDFPSLLFMDIEMLLEDLRQTFGGDPCWTLRRNPGIATQVRLVTRARSYADVRVLRHD
jgi:hypothetical protein